MIQCDRQQSVGLFTVNYSLFTIPTEGPMAVGRASIDPTWEEGQPGPTNDGPIPATDPMAVARDTIALQPTHDDLQPLTEGESHSPLAVPLMPPAPTPLPTAELMPDQISEPHLPLQENAPSFDQTPLQPPRSLPWLAWLIGLLLLLGSAFLASEAGWLSLGIEPLWSISNRPAAALTEASQTLLGATGYQVEGTISLSPNGGGAPSKIEFRHQHTQSASSVATFVSIPAGLNIPSLGPALEQGGTLRLQTITNGPDLYLQLPDRPDERWQKTTIDELTAFNLTPLVWPQVLGQLSQVNGKRTAGKTINGTKTKGYELMVPTGLMVGFLSPSLQSLPGRTTVRLYLSTHDARPEQITLDGQAGTTTVTGQLLFTVYDQPKPIDVPAGSSVSPGSLSDFLEAQGLVSVNSPASRDATRRADLDRLAHALDQFAAAQKPFGYPVAADLIRLDQPLADSIKQALQPYLETFPTDPLAPQRYYGYQSNGTSYRLTAVAETTGDETLTLKDKELQLFVRTGR